MSSPFSRTMRSLKSDNFYVSLAGLFVAAVLLILWGIWFFTAKVTFYEVSRNVHVTNKESVVTEFPSDMRGVVQRTLATRTRVVMADFPAEAMETIKPGQAALLNLDGKIGKQTGAISAIVSNVTYLPQGGGRIELLAETDANAPNPLEEGIGGEVKIEVEYITPVALVMRASGLFVDTPPTSFSPQKGRASDRKL